MTNHVAHLTYRPAQGDPMTDPTNQPEIATGYDLEHRYDWYRYVLDAVAYIKAKKAMAKGDRGQRRQFTCHLNMRVQLPSGAIKPTRFLTHDDLTAIRGWLDEHESLVDTYADEVAP